MHYEELTKLTIQDVQKRLNEARARLQELRFKLGANQVKNVREVRILRKTIARAQTILHVKGVAK
ncbi:MAG: 50S ribosomal protein L29 [Patescibacteria group bacterium]